MSDEEFDDFDIVHVGHDQAQEIINWAMSAASMVMLMQHSPVHQNPDQAVERLEGFLNAVDIMMENMPEHMVSHATLIATNSLAFADIEQAAVEELRAELDEL